MLLASALRSKRTVQRSPNGTQYFFEKAVIDSLDARTRQALDVVGATAFAKADDREWLIVMPLFAEAYAASAPRRVPQPELTSLADL
jgi:hypothetical protein